MSMIHEFAFYIVADLNLWKIFVEPVVELWFGVAGHGVSESASSSTKQDIMCFPKREKINVHLREFVDASQSGSSVIVWKRVVSVW